MKLSFAFFVAIVVTATSLSQPVRWARQTTNTGQGLRSIAMTSVNEGWAVGSGGTVLHTTNGGFPWNATPTQYGGNFNGVYFTSGQKGVIIGDISNILSTTDAGGNWLATSNPTINNLKSVDFGSANVGWTVGNYGTVLKTTDGGVSWFEQSSSTLSNFFGVRAVSEQFAYAVGANSSLYRTTNGGDSWVALSSPVSGATFYSVDCIDAQLAWVVGSNGLVLKTIDSGNTWLEQTSPTTNALRSVWVVDNSTVYAVGFYGTLVKTTNGTTWEVEDTGVFDNLWSIRFVGTDEGWIAGESGVILHTGSGPTSVSAGETRPEQFALDQNYPNPFNPTTEIRFQIAEVRGQKSAVSHVTLKVYDVLGREVRTLVSEELKAGSYETTFDAHGLASGVYFYRLQAGDPSLRSGQWFTQTKRLSLLR